MNKITKIGALLLALCVLVVSFATKAEIIDHREVSLVLTDGNNTCTISDYVLGSHAVSPEAQPVSGDNHDFNCKFLKSSAATLSISLTNLQSVESNTIESTQFTGTFTNFVKQGTIDNDIDLASFTFSTSTQSFYGKSGETIGELTGNLAIGGIVPAGQPAGTYTGTLDLTIQ